ncbi:UNKNOWN [Stylonychia lemnae]|uniref:Uncharacterized protein n=1 Tax=Stylonychia lemnae TaxID=5949 RepID=A0A078AVG3_STYLE|nr:UNKNOWN [Stylonychia lemnae]|eukprot:CDW86041.1 UNKNOWN [Stylonychia lemnae]
MKSGDIVSTSNQNLPYIQTLISQFKKKASITDISNQSQNDENQKVRQTNSTHEVITSPRQVLDLQEQQLDNIAKSIFDNDYFSEPAPDLDGSFESYSDDDSLDQIIDQQEQYQVLELNEQDSGNQASLFQRNYNGNMAEPKIKQNSQSKKILDKTKRIHKNKGENSKISRVPCKNISKNDSRDSSPDLRLKYNLEKVKRAKNRKIGKNSQLITNKAPNLVVQNTLESSQNYQYFANRIYDTTYMLNALNSQIIYLYQQLYSIQGCTNTTLQNQKWSTDQSSTEKLNIDPSNSQSNGIELDSRSIALQNEIYRQIQALSYQYYHIQSQNPFITQQSLIPRGQDSSQNQLDIDRNNHQNSQLLFSINDGNTFNSKDSNTTCSTQYSVDK